ncbi:ATP synthase subunit delta [Aquicella siphonis]|uniref:ATP synthase subunit delta n=1 Tax=Aquicella siphonis TaxID=254247 RepID=A0A5E4PKH7_9COXI|nr:F0F1 ATP synthase subunit delta [Aquicella siphonis]VVC76911.1 ATP synthase subunit delta [Aquicella siphonis]
MANLSSIARPYALAAFECARESRELPAWKAFLEAASCLAKQPAVVRLLGNPELSTARIFDFFHEILAADINAERKNFLLLLSQNKRLNVLPEIAEGFNLYYAALEKISKVRVITAVETPDSFMNKLSQALTKRIQREVSLQCEVDPALIGGAIIHIGDRVIDGSIRGKLTRLLESLTG